MSLSLFTWSAGVYTSNMSPIFSKCLRLCSRNFSLFCSCFSVRRILVPVIGPLSVVSFMVCL